MRRLLGVFGTLLIVVSIGGLALLAAGPTEQALTVAHSPGLPAGAAEPDLVRAAPPPEAASAPESPPSPGLLLDERFTDNRMDWTDNRQSTAWLEPGAYHLSVRVPGHFVAVGAPVSEPLRDVRVSARFRKAGGPPGGGYGLIVRDDRPRGGDGIGQDGRYYVLEVGDRGEVGIWRREEDRWIDLLPWTASEAVRPGGETNDIEVWAIGDRLTLLVNGVQVASHIDAVLGSGRVGVFAGGDGNDVVLEDLSIRASAQPATAEVAPTPEARPAAQGPPPTLPITRVVIPRTSLEADAVPARLVDRQGGQTWEVPAYKIGHAEGTAGAGGAGNAVLVGHVTSQTLGNVFHDLDQLRVGDAVQVFSGAQRFDYQVVDVRTVDRNDVSVVGPTPTPSLTLMTCTGVWLPVVADYAQRLVVRAELQPGSAS